MTISEFSDSSCSEEDHSQIEYSMPTLVEACGHMKYTIRCAKCGKEIVIK